MNISEVQIRIEEIENYSYENFSNVDYRYILKKMSELIDGQLNLLVPSFPTDDLRIFRCRQNKDGLLFQNSKELWHPPEKNTPHGRLNFQYKPILYTSHNAATAMIEIDAYKLKYFTTVEYKININEIKTIEFGLKTISDKERKLLDLKTKIIMEFINRQAKKVIPKNQIQYYCPTMIFATSVSQNNNFDAFVYESVATNHNGINFAFKTKFAVKYLEPIEFRYLEVIETIDSNNFSVQCISKSKSIERETGKIVWEEVSNCSGHHIDSSEFVYHNQDTSN